MPRRVLGLLFVAACLSAQQYAFVPIANSPKNIEHLFEDKQGRLWISAHGDVLSFDGTRFFSLRDFGLPTLTNASPTLVEDDEGGILICSELGVHRLFQGRVEQILAGEFARYAVKIAPGVFLVGVADYSAPRPSTPYRVRAVHGRWQAERLSRLKITPYATLDRAGAVLYPCPAGWCEVQAKTIADLSPGGTITPVMHKSDLPIERVLRDRFGCVWFRSQEAGAYQCPGDPQPTALPASVAGRNVWSEESETEDGSMVIASVASLAVGRPGTFQVVSPDLGLPAEAVTSAIRSRDGSIWVGSIGGLYRFAYPFRLQYWKSRQGLFWSIVRSREAMLGGSSAGVARLGNDGEWRALPGSREFGSVRCLLPEPDGSVYAAIAEKGIALFGPDGALPARTPPGQGGAAQVLARDAQGSIWLAGSAIYRVARKGRDITLAPEPLPTGLSVPTFIASGPSGGLWGCSFGRVIRRQAGIWQTVARNGVPQTQCFGLAFPPGGDVWAGYRDAIVLVAAGSRGAAAVRTFHNGGEIGDATSWALGVDARGWLWRGSADGMYLADPAQAGLGVWLRLDHADGLPELDVNHGSFFADRDGSVWWAAATSVMHFTPPPDLIHPANPPAVFLSAFSVEGTSARLAETVQELPSRKRLVAHIGSLQFQARNALRVRYRLLPGQTDWRESSTLDLDLGTPWWGTHRLEIQSRFSNGSWSPTWGRQVVLLRPWWFSWPALLALAGVGCGCATAVAWRRRKARANTGLPDLGFWRLAVLSPESQLLGVTLDERFEVLELVTHGGFATILKGRDRRQAGRACAIKVFRSEIINDQWLTHRFQQEMAALEQICHPSVVSFFGHGVAAGGTPYLAMEFVEGGTLRDLLNAGPVPPARAGSLLRQVAEALEQIHARGIYHRDVKPENLMLRAGAPEGEELVLIDFSIAIVQTPDQTMHGLSRAAGTIYYMAPEQAVGFATRASDVYSLAKVLLEMFTGHLLSTLLPRASMDLPERVRELVRGLPIPLSAESVDLLGQALEFDPTRRPQTVMQFAQPIVRDLSVRSSAPSASPGLSPTDGARGAPSGP